VIGVALQHHLVSQYTSLVAIDQTPQGLNATCKAELLPAADPADHDEAGSLPQTATPAALLLMIGASLSGVALLAMKFVK
jgi:Ca-activated chloride channel homolog